MSIRREVSCHTYWLWCTVSLLWICSAITRSNRVLDDFLALDSGFRIYNHIVQGWHLDRWLCDFWALFRDLWLTPNITKMIMNRIANVIKKICQFFISSSFSRLFSPNSLFFDKVFWSVVTVNEKTTNFFTSALCDAGVAVTLTCVTMPRGVLGSDERINRKELVCWWSINVRDGTILPFIRGCDVSAWK